MGAWVAEDVGACELFGVAVCAAIAAQLVDSSAIATTHLIDFPLLPQSTCRNMTLSIHRYNQVYASFPYRLP
jgi:hypothetical protein